MRHVGGAERGQGLTRQLGILARARRIAHAVIMLAVTVHQRALVKEDHALGLHARHRAQQPSRRCGVHETGQHDARDPQLGERARTLHVGAHGQQ